MMKIIITMAGEGSRFRKEGFTIPKHEIIANKKSLFEWSLLSLSDFFNEEFIFIVRKGMYSKDFINIICDKIKIKRFFIIEIEELTDGQATTAYMAENYIGEEEEVCIYNIDTYVKEGNILKKDLIDSDGYIPAFKAQGDKWSFIKVENNKVIDIQEKIRISDLGTIGFYHFKNWKDYKRIYLKYRNEIKKDYKEVYIAPIYKYMINDNMNLTYKIIDKENFYVLGTPEDIEEFAHNYKKENMKFIKNI